MSTKKRSHRTHHQDRTRIEGDAGTGRSCPSRAEVHRLHGRIGNGQDSEGRSRRGTGCHDAVEEAPANPGGRRDGVGQVVAYFEQ